MSGTPNFESEGTMMASHKMDETKYEFIEGGFLEALELMNKGETVYDRYGRGYVLNASKELHYINSDGEFMESSLMFNSLARDKWYKKKPFDVRQAMRERPSEWVGAYERHGRWYKVAFDSRYFRAIETRMNKEIEVDFTNADCSYVDPDALDKCIPIEDVPEEARR